MKTQVIKLDQHDNVTSVRDKMSWAKTERILLVYPRRKNILVRTLDLHLLQRHAATLGADIAIVSRSIDERRSAEELKIPAFTKVDVALRKPWDREKEDRMPVRRDDHPNLDLLRHEAFSPEEGWRSNFGLRFALFTLAVLAILAVFSLFIPSATIILKPAVGMQNLTLRISASQEVTTINLAGNLPARISSLILEQSRSTQVTGKVSVPEEKAQGVETFRNLTSSQMSIPAGTVIRTQSDPSIRFTTTIDATVAAGVDKKVDVPIQAVEAGTSGNLPTEVLVSLEGELGASLAVTNSKPTTGGLNRTASIQTVSDRANLRASLLTEFLGDCGPRIQQNLAKGDIYIPDTLDVSQVLAETYFPAEDQSGDTLSLTMRVKCQAQYAGQTDLNSLALMSLDATLPEGYIPASSELKFLPTSKPLTGVDGVTHWEMQVQRLVRAQLDPLTIVQLCVGKNPPMAVQQLKKSLPLADLPVIQLNPAWWPWMPLIPFRISVSSGN